MKRDSVSKDLVMVIGNKGKSKLLEKAILISRKGKDRSGRSLHIVSYKMEKLLGISGSIQRSKPIRFIEKRKNLENLQEILND